MYTRQRQYNFTNMKRTIDREKRHEEIVKESKERNEKAFQKKHRVPLGQPVMTKEDYLRKYFVMDE